MIIMFFYYEIYKITKDYLLEISELNKKRYEKKRAENRDIGKSLDIKTFSIIYKIKLI